MKKEKKMNNKGFSLVELIIVIAIMAVLIAVLAPQYMRFIERGRVASDRDNIKAIQGALEVYYVDPVSPTGSSTVNKLANGDSLTITRTGVSGGSTGILDALKVAGILQTSATDYSTLPKLTNQENFSQVVITVNIDTSTGTASVTAVESTPAP